MNSLLIRGGNLVLPEKEAIKTGDLLIQEGRIACLGEVRLSGKAIETIDATGLYVSPGFIDLQTNGGAGYNFGDATAEEIRKIIAFHIARGTTGLLPTTVTAPIEAIRNAVQQVHSLNHPAVLGMHIEGPFIATKRKGAHNAHHILTPSVERLNELLAGYEGFIKIVTLAPELPGADQLISRITEIGAVPSFGHSDATYRQTIEAIEHGISLFTHMFNAMRGPHHREPGVVGAALDSEVMVELICDGVHVHPVIVRLLLKAKGIDEICLITDSISAAGLADGEYSLGGLVVFVQAGQARLADGTLSGSTLTMNQAVKKFIEFTGCSLSAAVKAASLNPARLLAIDERKGSLEEGKDADIVIFDEGLDIHYTIIGGEVFYARDGGGRCEQQRGHELGYGVSERATKK